MTIKFYTCTQDSCLQKTQIASAMLLTTSFFLLLLEKKIVKNYYMSKSWIPKKQIQKIMGVER